MDIFKIKSSHEDPSSPGSVSSVTLHNRRSGFANTVKKTTSSHLHSESLDIFQVNVGLKCNLKCIHCHINASPERTEIMSWDIMEKVLNSAKISHVSLVDITGGAPEMNPHFRRFLKRLTEAGHPVQVRTNLTVLHEDEFKDFPDLYKQLKIQLVGSLPCYMENNVNAQRGSGVYGKSIGAIKILNDLGYGNDPDYVLNLVYNPGGGFLPPDQKRLEKDYKRQLEHRFGITFTHLLTITNMPIGRFKKQLLEKNRFEKYMTLLKDSFNPQTLDNLMCRNQISISWDGTLYDCDFNMALGMPINHGTLNHIDKFEGEHLLNRKIVVGDHCFGCTAGQGSSCSGSIVP